LVATGGLISSGSKLFAAPGALRSLAAAPSLVSGGGILPEANSSRDACIAA
jgi:hypothetical protein